MKRFLALLTVALLGATATASAANYYDYYENVSVSAPTTTMIHPDPTNEYWTAPIQSDVVTYDNYQIIRTTAPNGEFNSTIRYKIRVTGEKVDIYLTDFIDNVQSDNNVNALTRKNITEFGYRYLDSQDSEKIGTSSIKDLIAADTPIDSHYFEPNQWYTYTVTRNQYYLGTFEEGDEFEIYMKDSSGNSAWSDSIPYKGGYGEGIDVVEHTDKLMLYYKNGDVAAANKAMPLAALDVPSRVYFGIYVKEAETFGAPLPGGFPIVLVSGLFALGFFFRRKKAMAA